MVIRVERRDEFAILIIDRQEQLNALSFQLLADIGAAVDGVGKSDARALIVTGAGEKAFCAGADIAELRGRTITEQRQGAAFGQYIFSKLDDLPMVSVAAINGYAFGGGLELAMACTFRVALQTAKMGLPEIKLGLIPGYGGTQRLPRLVGESRALQMIMSGRTLSASEAAAWGIVDELAESDLIERSMAFARPVTQHSLAVLPLVRSAVRRSVQSPLSEGLKVEAELSTLAYQTADAAEGMTAFIEKRKPVFTDG